MKVTRNHLHLIFIIILAAFLRFYNLMFDSPHFFNPDERNMANSITQMRLPSDFREIPICLISQIGQISTSNCNLHPHFFAYGQFPLYLSFFSDQISQRIIYPLAIQPPTSHFKNPTSHVSLHTSFQSAIFWLRFWSALSSTLVVLLVYLISKQLFSFKDESRITNHEHEPKQNTKRVIGLFNPSYLAAMMAAFTPGLIQSAHFGTTESLLTFFFIASIYLSLTLINSKSEARNTKQIQNSNDQNSKRLEYSNLKNSNLFRISDFVLRIFLLSLICGLAIGTKLTGIIFIISPFIVFGISIFTTLIKRRKNWKKNITKIIGLTMTFIGITAAVAIASSPFNIIDYNGFRGSVFGYESDVATGKYQAFYTRQFAGSIPLLFQMEKIFPYALGWPIFILGTLGFLLINLQLIHTAIVFMLCKIQNSEFRIQNKNKILNSKFQFLIINSAFLIYLLPNAFLYAKWTRFITPIFPFFAIFSGYFIFIISKISKNKFMHLCIVAFSIVALLPGIAFMSIYAHDDTRVQASRWIYDKIPDNSYILFDTGNVIDIPLALPKTDLPAEASAKEGELQPTAHYTLVSFDFYHLDENPKLLDELIIHLQKADYIIIPSRRIFTNYMPLPDRFPRTVRYFETVFSGELGFEKVKEISSFPGFSLFNFPALPAGRRFSFPDEQSEETFTVFDHPVIRIYRKVKPLTQQEYQKLFIDSSYSLDS